MFSTRVLVGVVEFEKFIYEGNDWTNFKKDVLDPNSNARFKYCTSEEQVEEFYQLCITKGERYKLKSTLKSLTKFRKRLVEATKNLRVTNMIVDYKHAGQEWVVGATLTLVAEASLLEFRIAGVIQYQHQYVISAKTLVSTPAIYTIMFREGYPDGDLCIRFSAKEEFDAVYAAISSALGAAGQLRDVRRNPSRVDYKGKILEQPLTLCHEPES